MTSIRHLLVLLARRVRPLVRRDRGASPRAHGFNVGSHRHRPSVRDALDPRHDQRRGLFRQPREQGRRPDRLIRAVTPVAQSVEMHTMAVDAQGVMRMREVDGIALAPKCEVQMRPGGRHAPDADRPEGAAEGRHVSR